MTFASHRVRDEPLPVWWVRPVSVQADWGQLTTIRLRRTAAGDAQIVELNGVALNPPPTLVAEAQCTCDFSSLFSRSLTLTVRIDIRPGSDTNPISLSDCGSCQSPSSAAAAST